ncbi:response regulator transcription factor [Rhizohabitans arisaemae]|uniref:response regulator transcription factor n=1 Tax=Rhizohabitans arisaemae TaxID=2720610 RepID=UPI0031FF38A7
MRVLIVEDDERLAAALGIALKRFGYDVLHAGNGAEARLATGYDLILLDLTLPDEDGLDICRHVRENSDVAIIALTARGAEHDRIRGLRAGADDYIVKPFSMGELEARIQAVLRRARLSPAGTLTLGDLEIDLDTRRVRRAGRPVDLAPKEFALLSRLALTPGVVVSRERLLLEIWKTCMSGTSRTLDVHMTTLRAKLGQPNPVDTVRGVGYRLLFPVPPAETDAGSTSCAVASTSSSRRS